MALSIQLSEARVRSAPSRSTKWMTFRFRFTDYRLLTSSICRRKHKALKIKSKLSKPKCSTTRTASSPCVDLSSLPVLTSACRTVTMLSSMCMTSSVRLTLLIVMISSLCSGLARVQSLFETAPVAQSSPSAANSNFRSVRIDVSYSSLKRRPRW